RMGMNVRPLAALDRFLWIERRIVDGKHVTMPSELLAEELTHGSFEGDTIRAGSRRDNQVHDVPALATMQFLAPFFQNEIAGVRGVADQLASVVADLSFRIGNQLADTRRSPL